MGDGVGGLLGGLVVIGMASLVAKTASDVFDIPNDNESDLLKNDIL